MEYFFIGKRMRLENFHLRHRAIANNDVNRAPEMWLLFRPLERHEESKTLEATLRPSAR